MPVYKVITPAAAEPFTLTEIKSRLNISDSVSDDQLTEYIKVAREEVEGYLGCVLMDQTIEVPFDEFADELELDPWPVQSITSVTYADTDGNWQTVASSDYSLDDYSATNYWLMPAVATTWPESYAGAVNAVKVRYQAGYASADDIPRRIMQAMETIIGYWLGLADAQAGGDGFLTLPRRIKGEVLDGFRKHRL